MNDQDARTYYLILLLPYMTASERSKMLGETLGAAHSISRYADRARALTLLTQHVSISDRSALFEAALAAANPSGNYFNSELISWLAARLPDVWRELLVRKVLAVARSMKVADHRVRALALLAPFLSESEGAAIVGDALTAARSIEESFCRARGIYLLAPFLSNADRDCALGEALESARATSSREGRADALAQSDPWVCRA